MSEAEQRERLWQDQVKELQADKQELQEQLAAAQQRIEELDPRVAQRDAF